MSTKTTVVKTESGFTLVELMVVVAIIGILAAIAIPNFRKYQAKSRTSEAKLMLAAAYTSEEAYYQEYNHYSTCLSFMGFLPTGFTTTSTVSTLNYYSVGFNAVNTRPTGVNTANIPTGCDVARAFYYLGGRVPAGAASFAANPLATRASLTASGSAYEVEANGIIDQDFALSTTDDSWVINQTKALIHNRNGY